MIWQVRSIKCLLPEYTHSHQTRLNWIKAANSDKGPDYATRRRSNPVLIYSSIHILISRPVCTSKSRSDLNLLRGTFGIDTPCVNTRSCISNPVLVLYKVQFWIAFKVGPVFVWSTPVRLNAAEISCHRNISSTAQVKNFGWKSGLWRT